MRLSGRDIAEDQAVDDLLGCGEAAVHIACRDDGLHSVGDDGVALAAAAVLLAVAEQQEASQTDGRSRAGQILFADQIRTDAGQLALGLVREAAVQIVRHDEAQDGIAQKLQTFVVVQAALPVFIGIGAVRQRVFENALVPERVAQPGFQFTQHVDTPLERPYGRYLLPVSRRHPPRRRRWPAGWRCGWPARRTSRAP